MSMKLIAPLTIAAAGLLVAACGKEQQVDVGPTDRPPAVAAYPEGYPLTADGAIRRELAKLETERRRTEAWGDWPLTADGAIRRELAELEAERATG
jgi:hypothetical protein